MCLQYHIVNHGQYWAFVFALIELVQINIKLEKVTIAIEATSRQSFWTVFTSFVLRMRTNCYLLAFNQNSDIAVVFSYYNNRANLANK